MRTSGKRKCGTNFPKDKLKKPRFRLYAITLYVVVLTGSVALLALRNPLRFDHPSKISNQPVPEIIYQPPPPIHKVTPKEFNLSWKTRFGQFPPYTEAERELERMLRRADKDVDLGLANWLIVADIPQFHDMTREAYFQKLDDLTDRVREKMAEMESAGWPSPESNKPSVKMARFCDAIRSLHVTYVEGYRETYLPPEKEHALFRDANNIFLAGILRTGSGCCASIPMVYLVIGQRLEIPMYLVTCGKHYFLRWEEPGLRINIEPTITDKVTYTPDETVYLETEGMTRDQVRGCELRNLNNREVVGELFHNRGCYWGMNGPKAFNQSLIDAARAYYLLPDDPKIQKTHDGLFAKYNITPTVKAINIWIKDKNGNDISGNKMDPPDWMVAEGRSEVPEIFKEAGRSKWNEEHGITPMHPEGRSAELPVIHVRTPQLQPNRTQPPGIAMPSIANQTRALIGLPGGTGRQN